jgi:hypothetical protein
VFLAGVLARATVAGQTQTYAPESDAGGVPQAYPGGAVPGPHVTKCAELTIAKPTRGAAVVGRYSQGRPWPGSAGPRPRRPRQSQAGVPQPYPTRTPAPAKCELSVTGVPADLISKLVQKSATAIVKIHSVSVRRIGATLRLVGQACRGHGAMLMLVLQPVFFVFCGPAVSWKIASGGRCSAPLFARCGLAERSPPGGADGRWAGHRGSDHGVRADGRAAARVG